MTEDNLWHNKTLLATCLGMILLMAGVQFPIPILPEFVLALGVAPAQIGIMVGLVIAILGIGRVVINLPAGKIAQVLGRRPLFIFSLILVTISALVCGLTTKYWQLLICRFFQGLGSAAFVLVAMITIGEISTPSNRGRCMSFFWGSLLIGTTLGPILGGFMGQYLGYRAPFFFLAGIAFLDTLWAYFCIPETKEGKLANPPISNDFQSTKKPIPLYQNLNFILICIISMGNLITVSGQMILIPLLGYERLNLTEGEVGFALAIIFAMQFAFVFLAGRLSDKLGRKIIIIPGQIIMILGLILYTQSYNYGLLLFSGAMLGAGRGLSDTVLSAYLVDIASPQNYEYAVALYRTASDIGFTSGPIFLGWFKDIKGLNFPFFLIAGIIFGAVIPFAILAKEAIAPKKRKI